MTVSPINKLFQAFRSQTILVIGDVMLDRFIWGKVSRVSPEAPVPVVEVKRDSSFPGGAANVARNLAPFTDHVHVFGRIGEDAEGGELCRLLEGEGVRIDGLTRRPDFGTITKTRIIAHNQQVVRFDREQRPEADPEEIASLRRLLDEIGGSLDAIVVQDYAKGVVTESLMETVVATASDHGTSVVVDPNLGNSLSWEGVTIVKPNRAEAFSEAGITDSGLDLPPMENAEILEAGRLLLKKWGAEYIMMTLGEDGMVLFGRERPPEHIPTRARQVYDVSGAGDTAAALLALSIAAGLSPKLAAEVANEASGLVVGKIGTALATPDELGKRLARRPDAEEFGRL